MYEKLLLKEVAIVTVIIVLSIAVIPTLLMMSANKAKAATTTSSRSEQVIAAINDPNNILSGSGQGQIQCPANPAATAAFRSLQISFGANRIGGTITGSFDVSNNLNGRSVIAGSIDSGQLIQNHFTLTGITKETFGFACGSSSTSSAATTASSSTISNNGVPISNTLVIPTRITISGQCEIGATTTTTMQFTAANGQTGTFAGPVSCG
jgi:hypothetical protein